MKIVDPFYVSKAWRLLRRQAIGKLVPAGCAQCGNPFTSIKNIHVDHIIPRKEAPHLALCVDNLRLMHHHCHSVHTRNQEQASNDNTQEVDANGYPAGWR